LGHFQTARRLSLRNHPECSTLSGGQAIELLAKEGDRYIYIYIVCAVHYYHVLRPHNTLWRLIAKQTHRAILFCKSKEISLQTFYPNQKSTLPLVSGGAASNEYIRQTLKIVTDATGLHLLCPPTKFCTDNGVMIAWNGIERLKQRKGIMSYTEKGPLELDITSEVKDAAIRLPPLKLSINS
uniref:Gcp-like domain-containing protein n=1 Tax=Cyprinus carpio TaxID=7962 RepID=A0A8C2AGY9_CYPCA